MDFRILGPVDVLCDGRMIALGGPKPRALVAILLLASGEVVSRDRLIDGLWGSRPPPSAGHTLDDHLSRLRKVLGPDRIETRRPGYRLRVDAGELDLDRFEEHLRDGREALAAGDAATALARLDNALALWRGPAFADIGSEPVAEAHAGRLEERRLLALEEQADAAIALGREANLIAPLEQLVVEHPFRERLLGQLALSLYRAGRQAEALAALSIGRRRFAEELGLEPGPELQALQRRILAHDPGLAPLAVRRSRTWLAPRRRDRWLLGVAVAAAVLLVAATTSWVLLRESSSADLPAQDLVGLGPGTSAGGFHVHLDGAPAAMAVDGHALWLADPTAGAVSRVDVRTRRVDERIALERNPGVLAVAGGSLWVAGVPGTSLTRIDPATDAVTQTIPLNGAAVSALATGAGGLWIADTAHDALIEIDPRTGSVKRTISVDLHPTAMAIGAGRIWIADYRAHAVAEIDPGSGRTLAHVEVGNGPVALAVTRNATWVASALDSTVSRIDPGRGAVVATLAVGSGPVSLAANGRSVWVASQFPGTITEIDAAHNVVVRRRPVRGSPTSLESAAGTLWIGVRPRTEPRGGTLVLLRTQAFSVDPVAPTGISPFQVAGLTSDSLLAVNHAAGTSGLQLVPDLAIGLPSPTDDGQTYTFRLRPGIRYSDGRLVRASDFRRAIERAFVLRALNRDVLEGIRGVARCSAAHGTACDLRRGVATDDRTQTVTISLAAADPRFLEKLTTSGLATPAPPGTPMHLIRSGSIPGTGPYVVAAADMRHVRYVRNPRFREWSHAAQPAGNPDEIVWRFGLSPAQEVRAVAQGHADWSADPIPGRMLAGLRARYPSRLHSYPTNDTEWLQFNTNLPPFDNVRVRRALNFAIDRRAIVRLWGGSVAAAPTCQMLPPGIAGYRAYCPYTRNATTRGSWTAPDLRRARRLVAASGTRGMSVTVWGWSDDAFAPPSVVRHAVSVLRRLGYRARSRLVTHASLANASENTYAGIHLFPTGWTDISADGYFTPWLSCDGSGAHHWFCVPRLDRAMRRARRLEATRPLAVDRLYARIDREIVDRAALVPLVNPRLTDFVSARVRNLQHHVYLGPIVDQIALR